MMFSKDEEVQRIRTDNKNKFDAIIERLKVYYSMAGVWNIENQESNSDGM